MFTFCLFTAAMLAVLVLGSLLEETPVNALLEVLLPEDGTR